jgi:hypothetical protein
VPSPHPLARALASAVVRDSTARILVLGSGNGRNVTPFTQIGVAVDVLEQDATRSREAAARYTNGTPVRVLAGAYAGPYPFVGGFAGALSTSALLHGTASSVAQSVAAVRAALRPEAPFFCTFGSTRDPRFGKGRRIDRHTFAPESGSEAAVAHAYFDESQVRAMLAGFQIDELTEASAAETVGAWAHTSDEAAAIVHWFVRARRVER